jgi:hypothetical protein
LQQLAVQIKNACQVFSLLWPASQFNRSVSLVDTALAAKPDVTPAATAKSNGI